MAVKKANLADLLGESNVHMHPDDEKKRKQHKMYRTPRHRLTFQRLDPSHNATTAERDIKYNMVALEFLNNGLKQTKAYASVFGLTIPNASNKASKLFGSSWFRAKLALMMMGSDGKLGEMPKEYLLQKVVSTLEMNILDYVGDDGLWLTVPELRKLPLELQRMLEGFTMVNRTRPVGLKTADGQTVLGADGEPYMVEVKEQTVMLKLPDRHKSMELLAKLMDWITSHTEHQLSFIDAVTMQDAEARIKTLRRDDLEGKAERLTPD